MAKRKSKSNFSLWKIVLIFATSIVLIILGYTIAIMTQSNKVELDEPLEVPMNTSTEGVVKLLNKEGMLNPIGYNLFVLRALAFLEGKKIYAGYYDFHDGITNYQVIKKLINGDKLPSLKVTLIPNATYKQFAEILASKINFNKEKFLKLCESDSLLKARNIVAPSVDGYLAPDTYEFYYKHPADKLLDKLLNQQDKVFSENFNDRLQLSKYTKTQILTMASIVQGETNLPDEGKKVAGLYYNRLNIKMPLQADPTVLYALGKKKRLLYKDLEIESPYNTYRVTGLPPGPIGNPSKSAIEAAINPDKHSYLFMVAKGDGTYRHNFSKSLNEHNHFVAEYRKKVNN
ncbi:MAG: endolytic transglycosylase MltG [Candidatus Kapabacteria bacterium]|nr:endolytic transglycosylase MltG [Candidatus Kapabacteria bacterium]